MYSIFAAANFFAFALGAAVNPRQVSGQVYCLQNDGFNPADCRAAMDRINTDGYYRDVAEFRYGDCSVDIYEFSATQSISGSTYKDAAGRILDTCADGAGYVYEGGLRVEVTLCQVCMRGSCVTCKSPGQGPLKRRELALEDTKHSAMKRQDEPEAGIKCFAGAATKADACNAAADEIEGRGGSLTLPFREGFTDCQVAVEQTAPGLEVSVTTVAEKIRHGSGLCESQGYIGYISDTREVSVHVFWGRLCGKFNFGYGGCTP